MSLISLQSLSVKFGRNTVMRDVNLSVDAGEIVTIVGPNGSGKSTLLRTMIGAINPDTGSVVKKLGLKIGYVPQKLQLDPTLPMTVQRFMGLPLRVAGQKIKTALENANVAGLAGRQMSDLSGGQFQRVLLARAILHDPDILLLDEATQGLDQPGSAAFYRQIADLRDRLGCAIVMVSHELHVVMAASDRVICVNGHICCEGRPEAVASAPEYRALFGSGTGGALALYRHEHAHHHHHDEGCDHDHV